MRESNVIIAFVVIQAHANILFSNIRQMKECTRNLLRAKVFLICAGQGKPSNGSLLTHKHSCI